MIYEDYTILTPGPVKMSKEILELGAKQVPYFRNKPFSEIVLASEQLLFKLVNAPKDSRVIFLTASGTAGMESVVLNLLNTEDKALVVNGGTFGQRFCDICHEYAITFDEIHPNFENLCDIENRVNGERYSAMLTNAHETSIGLLYDLDTIGDFCYKHNILNIVDAISMFTTDTLDMLKQHIDVAIISSQKGLALPPGLTMIILGPKALKKLNKVRGLYFNFNKYLTDSLRGQTPFTPAVSIIIQLFYRLQQINYTGGTENTIEKAKQCAQYFREKIQHLPLQLLTQYSSNGLSALRLLNRSDAKDLIAFLEREHKIIVCPNGGEYSETVFRVAHMGEVNLQDMDKLIDGLCSYFKKKA